MQDPEARKRWLALLEELGLPPDPEPTPAAQAEPPAQEKPQAAAEPVPEPLPASLDAPAPEAVAEPVSEPAAEEAPVARSRRRRTAVASEPELDASPGAALEASESPETSEVAKEPATRTRRRRRTAKPVVEAAEPEVAEDLAVPAGDEASAPALEEATAELVILETEVRESVAAVSVAGEAPFLPPETREPHTQAHAEGLPEAPKELEGAGFDAGLEELGVGGHTEEPEHEAGEGETPAKDARRRRRRRRGRKPSEAAEGAATRPAPVRPEEEAEDDEASVVDESLGEDVVEEITNETPSALDEEADEFEDLSNLNMPSWAELVGSLYRPPDR